jgi:ABC-type branched-subunit amino acid transport system ATPase component
MKGDGKRPADDDILGIAGLSRRFGTHEVVRSLDLKVEPGRRVALAGPNGSGKTTVLRCIAGTLTPTAGRISIGGHAAGTIEARRLVGASFSRSARSTSGFPVTTTCSSTPGSGWPASAPPQTGSAP